jgi:hypothetical protein
VLLFFTTPLWAQTGQYDYPIKNPYIATVVGTPASLKAILPEEKDVRSKEYELTVFPDREVPIDYGAFESLSEGIKIVLMS